MELLFLGFMLVLNFGISWWNAYACGLNWREAQAVGGFIKLVVWSGAIMSALGFSMVYMALITFCGYGLGLWDKLVVETAMAFWYLLAIIPILGSGLIITVHSWQVAWRERSLLNMGVAGWNTYAQVSNILGAFEAVPQMFGKIMEGAKSDSNKNGALIILCVLIAIVAIAGGVLTTASIMKRQIGRLPEPRRSEALA